MDTFQSLLAKKLSDGLASAGLPATGELTQATDPRFGDYQANVALVLGKQRGENPRALAEKIVAHLDVEDFCEPPAVAGAGFINFTLRQAAVEKQTLEILRDERLGVAETESPRRIVIDFGSPNVAKPMHVGHIRSTALGDALARVAKFLGHEVIRDNHIGDWGTQFGMVIWGWRNLLDHPALQRDPLAEISEGAVVVFFRDDPELVDKPLIIRKRDGGFNYATTDVATIDYRVNELKADVIWYVVGAPQTLHFKQIFAVARREGYTTDLRHIIFGSVLGEDRKLMKTRSGENVPLRELLEEACRRARKIIDEKNPDLRGEEKNKLA